MSRRGCLLLIVVSFVSAHIAFSQAAAGDAPPLIRERMVLKDHDDMVWAVAFSPDGKTLAAVTGLYNRRGALVLWDPATGKVRATAQEPRGIRSVAFAPDGKLLATADYYSNTVKLRDPNNGNTLAVLNQGAANNAVAFSPDGKKLAVGLLRGLFSAKIWDVATNRELATMAGHAEGVSGIAWSPDGKLIVTGSGDGTAKVWDATTGRERMTLKHEGLVEYVAFSPDGRTLATASWDTTAKLWETASGRERATLKGHKLQVLSVAFSLDGRLLATTTGQANMPIAEVNATPGEVKLWDVATQKELASVQGSTHRVWCATFSPDGKTLATANEERIVKLWDIAPRKEVPRAEPTAKEVQSLWADLAGEDAAKAYRAIWPLAASPKQALPLLKKQLAAPPPKADPQRIAQLIADLEPTNEFEVRDKAAKELANLGLAAEPALRKALEAKPSPEVRRQAEALLTRLTPGGSPDTLLLLRCLEVAEHMATPEARQLLESIAESSPRAWLKDEAKLVLERLNKRVAARPNPGP